MVLSPSLPNRRLLKLTALNLILLSGVLTVYSEWAFVLAQAVLLGCAGCVIYLLLPDCFGTTTEGGICSTPDFASSTGVLRFEVVKSRVDHKPFLSPETHVGRVPWRIIVTRSGADSKLLIALYSDHQQSTPWRVEVEADVKLLNSDRGDDLIKQCTGIYEADSNCKLGLVLDWEQITNKERGFINDDDALTVEIHLRIRDSKGIWNHQHFDLADPTDPRHDVTLLIDGNKIHVNKAILSSHSPFFQALFYSDFAEKKQKEIMMEEIDYLEFLELLSIVYPSNKTIRDANVEYLLKLADRFQMAGILERCVAYLIGSKTIVVVEKLRIADKYSIYALKRHCLSRLMTKEDVEYIKSSSIYTNLSNEMKVALFERLLNIS